MFTPLWLHFQVRGFSSLSIHHCLQEGIVVFLIHDVQLRLVSFSEIKIHCFSLVKNVGFCRYYFFTRSSIPTLNILHNFLPALLLSNQYSTVPLVLWTCQLLLVVRNPYFQFLSLSNLVFGVPPVLVWQLHSHFGFCHQSSLSSACGLFSSNLFSQTSTDCLRSFAQFLSFRALLQFFWDFALKSCFVFLNIDLTPYLIKTLLF